MACAVSETKRGVYEAQQDFREIRDNFQDACIAELDAVWQMIKDLAVDLCPKESGALASSIELESEGGSGRISSSESAVQGAEFYHNAIYAGNDSICNPQGQPTSQYALAQHDGFLMRNGEFWEGTPFLCDAVDAYEDELNSIVDKALDSLAVGNDANPSTDRKGDTTD